MKTTLARQLRREATPEEQALWQLLRRHNLQGYKFRRQHPIQVHVPGYEDTTYFADFCCPAKHLIVELDGAGHAYQTDYDAQRDAALRARGYEVLRIANAQMREPAAVLALIAARLTSPPQPPSPSSLRADGEGGA